MSRTRLALGIVAGSCITLIGLGVATARAQDDDNGALDAIRAEIPEGNPGEYDLTEADALYGKLVEAYGQSTAVSDFGDGSELTGPCGGWAFSYNSDGELIDAAVDFGDAAPPRDSLDGGQAFTSGNPFKVDTRGVVVYYGFAPRSGDGPLDHRWEIKTSGISLDTGGDPNTNLKNRNAGLVDLAADLPVKFSAKVRVEGQMTSQNLDTCVGKGYVEFQGNGLLDPVGIAALALFAGGLFGLLFNARPAQTWKS